MIDKTGYTNSFDHEQALARAAYIEGTKPTAKEASLCVKRAAKTMVGSSGMLDFEGPCQVGDCKATCEPRATTLDGAIIGPCLVDTVGIDPVKVSAEIPKTYAESTIYVR